MLLTSKLYGLFYFHLLALSSKIDRINPVKEYSEEKSLNFFWKKGTRTDWPKN
jgi:hypothetical protein